MALRSGLQACAAVAAAGYTKAAWSNRYHGSEAGWGDPHGSQDL